MQHLKTAVVNQLGWEKNLEGMTLAYVVVGKHNYIGVIT